MSENTTTQREAIMCECSQGRYTGLNARTDRPSAAGLGAALFSGTKAEEQRAVAANVPRLYASGVGRVGGMSTHVGGGVERGRDEEITACM